MAQKFMLLYYFLLLLPYKQNSSQITKATNNKLIKTKLNATTIQNTTKLSNTTTTSTTTTANLSESTFSTRSAVLSTSLATHILHSLIMGSCFGSLLTKESTASSSSASLWRQATDEQEAELMSDDETNPRKQKFIYRIIKFKRKPKHKQFMDKFWEQQDANYTQLSTRNGNESISDIQLQHLDVQTLLSRNSFAKESAINAAAAAAQFSSRTSSSLDLEWEHEYGAHIRPYPHTHLPHPPLPLPPPPPPPTTTLTSTSLLQRNASDLTDSWQFLSQRHYFDDDPLNSLTSQHSSSLAAPTDAETTSCPADEEQAQTIRLYSAAQAKLFHKLTPQQQQSVLRPIGSANLTRNSSRTSCSHMSTPESLEWDIDEEQQRQLHLEDDNLGLETLELLHQIEQLKNKVLNETGDGLFGTASDEDIDGFTNVSREHLEEINIS